jgi:uncharacterized protein (TIGR03084 family)
MSARPAGLQASAADVLAGLRRRHAVLRRIVGSLSDDDWRTPTPAAGWTVRDQVAHLADTEEVAHDTLDGGPRAFAAELPRFPDADAFTAAGCRRGAGMTTAELVAWWDRAATRTWERLTTLAPAARVAWGFGMDARTFGLARTMEHWAHTLDVADALSPGIDADPAAGAELVAELGCRTTPWALLRAHAAHPGRSLRVELHGDAGTPGTLSWGPPDATDVVSAHLLQWCCLVTRRALRAGLSEPVARGPMARDVLLHARCYL